jgi:hypothetical protein
MMPTRRALDVGLGLATALVAVLTLLPTGHGWASARH